MRKLAIIFVLAAVVVALSGDASACRWRHRSCWPGCGPHFAPEGCVSNLHDSGPGSLRAAVQYATANPGTVIHFAPVQCGTINLTSGELDITQNTVIDGTGARRLAVSGTSQSRVFAISSGATVNISGLTITGGLADDKAPRFPGLGGGI